MHYSIDRPTLEIMKGIKRVLDPKEILTVIEFGKRLYMQGINYVTNEEGRRVAVQIDLKKYGEIWEDFLDILTAKKREGEPRESLSSVKARLKKKGKLNV